MTNNNVLEKKNNTLSSAKAYQECYVNPDNEFRFMDNLFIIDKSVSEYAVNNKAGFTKDFTNESYMDKVFVVLNDGHRLIFYNQNFEKIPKEKISVRKEA